jgi:hypothetical protein
VKFGCSRTRFGWDPIEFLLNRAPFEVHLSDREHWCSGCVVLGRALSWHRCNRCAPVRCTGYRLTAPVVTGAWFAVREQTLARCFCFAMHRGNWWCTDLHSVLGSRELALAPVSAEGHRWSPVWWSVLATVAPVLPVSSCFVRVFARSSPVPLRSSQECFG